jgi:tetratricopeptide (TPR) repeat protein
MRYFVCIQWPSDKTRFPRPIMYVVAGPYDQATALRVREELARRKGQGSEADRVLNQDLFGRQNDYSTTDLGGYSIQSTVDLCNWVLNYILELSDRREPGYELEYVSPKNPVSPLNPTTSEDWLNVGMVRFNGDLYHEAISNFTQALAINPNNATTYRMRGKSYLALQQYDKAISDYNQAIRLQPDFGGSYSLRGDVYYSLHQYKEALADYERAFSLTPSLLGIQKDIEKATKALRR